MSNLENQKIWESILEHEDHAQRIEEIIKGDDDEYVTVEQYLSDVWDDYEA